MIYDDDFSPDVNRLSVDLKSLKNGTNSCRSAIQELQQIREQLEKQLAELDNGLKERRSDLSDVESQLDESSLKLTDLRKRHQDVVSETEVVQRVIDDQNETIVTMKRQSQERLQSSFGDVAVLADNFASYANADVTDSERDKVSVNLDEIQQSVRSLTRQLESLRSGQTLASGVKTLSLEQSQQCVDQLMQAVSHRAESAAVDSHVSSTE